MKVYFVRHGQSTFNADPFHNKTHQFPTTPLAEEGFAQAEKVAERFKSIPVDIIYTSSQTRALQTAETINNVLQKKLVVADLLIEKRTPTILHGKDRNHPEAIEIKTLIKEHNNDPDWHYSDEENFFDFKARGLKFIEELEAMPYENVLVVTHGYIMILIALLMVYGDDLTDSIFNPFIKFAHTTNTGITMMEYDKEKWRLLTWNDYSHLGE
ncbi:MAG: histidine phosphatase family protein [Patescibacteria group bacterium]